MTAGASTLGADTLAFLAVANGAASVTGGTPERARALDAAFHRRYGFDPVDIAEVQDVEIPSAQGAVRARRYRAGGRARALLVYLHGGGWVVGSVDTHDRFCRLLARDAGIEVLSVEYRLAPEHPFPAGLDDAFAAVEWAAAHLADDLSLVVAGDSAGGNLASAVALRARDHGGPRIDAQVLLYPVLSADLTTESCRRFSHGYLLSTDDMRWFLDCYAPDHEQRRDPYLSPLCATDLSGLPATLVVVGDHDLLCDDARMYSERLAAAGTPVRIEVFEGRLHGFASMPRAIPSTQSVIAETIELIRVSIDELPTTREESANVRT